ncbi:MerR family transcriptional regulator [Terrabacter aeriphilus]|uniref:MerR family transcriptional regulator n=1 Tax=Terrabacter aeriphilus TaxID=515662 RepID=A0ABP9JB58_9MICO
MNHRPAGTPDHPQPLPAPTGTGRTDRVDRAAGDRRAQGAAGAGSGSTGSTGSVPELGWPVGAVSERLGIAAPTLRSWDRRHGVGPSVRTGGNHRRYTELDIRRVALMGRLTGQGVPAASAADSVLAMDAASIAAQIDAFEAGTADVEVDQMEDGAGGGLAGGADGAPDDPGVVVEAIVAAARALDTRTLAELYRRTMRRREVGQAWVEVFAPALRRVGDLWSEGRLGVQSEHLTSELLQSELRAVVRSNRLRVAGSPVVLASADDEQHHLPLLALEAELARNGVAGLFLGPRVPVDALLSALRETQARAVFLWASLARPADEPLWRDLEDVDWPLEVVIGGPGWPAGISVPEGPVVLTRVADFTTAVRTLTSPGGLAR